MQKILSNVVSINNLLQIRSTSKSLGLTFLCNAECGKNVENIREILTKYHFVTSIEFQSSKFERSSIVDIIWQSICAVLHNTLAHCAVVHTLCKEGGQGNFLECAVYVRMGKYQSLFDLF